MELQQTFALLEELLTLPITAGTSAADTSPVQQTFARIESPRGATVCALEADGERFARLYLRTGSYANWPVLASVVPGDLVGAVEDVLPIDLRIPGCPPTPAQIAEALLELIDHAPPTSRRDVAGTGP